MTTQFPETFDPETQEGNSWSCCRPANTSLRSSRRASNRRNQATAAISRSRGRSSRANSRTASSGNGSRSCIPASRRRRSAAKP